MAAQTNLPDRIATELAGLTGRSKPEMQLVLGVGAVMTGVTVVATVVYKTVAMVVDMDLFHR